MQFKKLFGVFNITTANVVDTFLSVIISKDMELDELADVYSKKLDGIIRGQQTKGLSYGGGTFKISYYSEKYFYLSFELYFQDKKGEWVKKSAKSKPQNTEYLNEKALSELRGKKKIVYEIDEQIS